MLCVVTWRGPVPWVHVHAEDLTHAASNASLARHVRVFHHGDDEPGWHFHWLLPRCDCEDQCPPREHEERDLPLAFAVVSFAAGGAHFVAALADGDWQAVSPPAVTPFTTHRAAFDRALGVASVLQTYPPSVSLRALIGVALC